MEKVLRLKTYVDGGINDTPFPNSESQVEIGEFRYDAKRMGGAPTITASVNYPSCLDNEWTDSVYAEFNGEKYYLKQTPTSSYDNEDVLYKHDLELVSERFVLDNVYFYDAVSDESAGDDKPVSNSTKVVFFGDVREFANRLGHSLACSGVDYTVVVDSDVTSEAKLISFEDQFFSDVLQEIYNTYEVPYYFEGKVIHIGYAKSDVVVPTFSYGVDDALLSITKNNANYKIVNRATATGSSDNIPFYYPNNSPKGDIEAIVSREGADVVIKDYERYANEVGLDEAIRYSAVPQVTITKVLDKNGNNYFAGGTQYRECGWMGFNDEFTIYINADKETNIALDIAPVSRFGKRESDGSVTEALYSVVTKVFVDGKQVGDGNDVIEMTVKAGETIVKAYMNYRFDHTQSNYTFIGNSGISCSVETLDTYAWYLGDKKVEPEKLGIKVGDVSVFREGDTITQTLVRYVNTSQNLMPSVYRETDGAERFYNATNDTYEGVEFNNPFVEGHPKEHIFTVEDIKPTIKEMMVNGLRIDMFSEFAYDTGDNDETYEDEEGNVYFKHPYFYGKLRVMDFNLFDHAIEQQPMTISFTSGHCGACNFEIGVTEDYPQKNPVQVDEEGNLIKDENGMVVAGIEGSQQLVTEFQERQQDTSKYEVWIALRKEEETYGILMPQVAHRPKAAGSGNEGDTFVILGINLPKVYITNAEKLLEAEIIKYIKDNNDEKFTFSIGFSRIYFEENESVLNSLSENSKIRIVYNNATYDLYVSSFSYSMSEGDALPQITVELDETLKISQNAIQNAISEVKSELGRALGNIDVVGVATPYFIRKDADDEAQGRINFRKGVKFGEGGKVEILDNNSAKLTIEYLEVTKKASFTSLEIQEKTHVGGQILVTPAAINCGEVEELDDAYRCYFQTKGADGDEIFNQFAVGDQAICQTFNAWGSKYYWRLVTAIGEDYIDLSKTVCDEDSDIPSAGDKIIQLGNQQDTTRQNAIVIAAYGDGSPYIIQYKGINAFGIPSTKIVTKLSSTENIFTGKVHMELGSDGLESLKEWESLQSRINNLSNTVEEAEKELDNVYDKATADGLITEAEQRAIDEAQAKVDAAKKEMEEYTDGVVNNLEIGGGNMIRNSGFQGNYVTQPLDSQEQMSVENQLFSSPLAHWEYINVSVSDSEESASGKVAVLDDGALAQELVVKIEKGENYIFSFKAKGEKVSFGIAGYSEVVVLDGEWKRYVYKFVAEKDSFYISIFDGFCALSEIQLEKGDLVSAWSVSPWDNHSELARFQSLQYLKSAIADGSTDVLGGVILSNLLLLGNPDEEANNSGISGIYNDDSDVAFWGGGSFEQAIKTALIYAENPLYQASEEEVASMAKYVVTHGGRAILNDIILRGYIYALGGKFQGEVDINAPNVNGRVLINDYGFVYYGTDADEEYPKVALGRTCQGASAVFLTPNADASFCTNAAVVAVGDSEYAAIYARGDVNITDGDLYVRDNIQTKSIVTGGGSSLSINVGDDALAISIPYGTIGGLRPQVRSITSGTTLTEYDHTIIVKNTAAITITLPSSPKEGQTYRLLHITTHSVTIGWNGKSAINVATGSSPNSTFLARRSVVLTYYNNTWYAEYINLAE